MNKNPQEFPGFQLFYLFWVAKNLVVGIPTPLKNDGVSWDDHSQLFLESHNPLMFQTTSQIGLLGDDITIVRWDYKLKYANL